ncbi:MAG: 3-dehydroquinate synthase [Bradymonadia bacterium]
MTTMELRVAGGTKTYPIYLRQNQGAELIERLLPLVKNGQICVLSDERVSRLYADDFVETLTQKGVNASLITVPEGERSKSLSTAEYVYKQLVHAGADRDTLLVAYGGGVIGDLGGFVAATFMRGLSYVQVPTTLLAQVDSSVGGKVGVNLSEGKNLVGAFYEPEFVWADTHFLTTLRERDIRNGMAEAIKHAVLRGESLLKLIEDNELSLSSGCSQTWRAVLPEVITVKLDVVERDFHERAERRHLNFGHSLAHALESSPGYGHLNHGEAVAIGMRAALRMSQLDTDLAVHTVTRLETLFDRLGFPKLSEQMLSAETLQYLRTDKKKSGGVQRLILLEALGRPKVAECDWSEITRKYESILTHPLMEA